MWEVGPKGGGGGTPNRGRTECGRVGMEGVG